MAVGHLRNLCSMDHRAARQPSKAILGLLPEKLAQRGHESTARRGRPPAGAKPQQVVLKQLSIKLRGRRNLRSVLGQPSTELLEIQQVAQHRLAARGAHQPSPHPPFRCLLQPRLREPVKPQRPAADDRQIAMRQLLVPPPIVRPQLLPAARSATFRHQTQRGVAHAIKSFTRASTPRSASTPRKSSAVKCV